MTATHAHGVRIFADDLTGAAEAADVVRRRRGEARVILGADERPPVYDHVVDLDLRNRPSEDAAAVLTRAFALGAADLVKIDSQLRGPVDIILRTALDRGAVVLAPALPAQDRVVRGGVVHVGGVPLDRSPDSAWRTEPRPAPRRIAELAPRGARVYEHSVEAVRAGLPVALRGDAEPGALHIIDAETWDDLQATAQAIAGLPLGTIPVGASALLDALLSVNAVPPARAARTPTYTAGPVLLVLGSQEKVVAAQLAAMSEPPAIFDATPALRGEQTLDAAAGALRAMLASERAVVAVSGPVEQDVHDVTVADRLGSIVASAVADRPRIALVLIGGETARRTLHHLGCTALLLGEEAPPGAAYSITDTGRRVVTRPGSFGGLDSLDLIVRSLGAATRQPQEAGQS